jgi:hypothetical protein
VVPIIRQQANGTRQLISKRLRKEGKECRPAFMANTLPLRDRRAVDNDTIFGLDVARGTSIQGIPSSMSSLSYAVLSDPAGSSRAWSSFRGPHLDRGSNSTQTTSLRGFDAPTYLSLHTNRQAGTQCAHGQAQ